MLFSRVISHAFVCALICGIFVEVASAAKPTKRSVEKETAAEVEFFAAMDSGELEVRVIAKNSTGGNVLLKNNTKKPLAIKLPDAFVGVPVAAQFGGGMGGMGGGMGGMGGGMGGMGGGMGGMGGGMNQAMGGGMGGGGMGGMGGGGMGGMGGGMGGGGMGGGGGGFFRVEPGKVGKLKIVTVCLEHGKKDPSPQIEYQLIPLDSYTKNTATIEAVRMLAKGEIDQHSAQAAVWNTENGLSWSTLATKIGAKHLDGSTELYFARNHIQRGMQIVSEAQRRAKEVKPAGAAPSSADSAGQQ